MLSQVLMNVSAYCVFEIISSCVSIFFMIGLPCIMHYVYNNQVGALFILSLLN
jgi:hypothetical protein